MHMVLSLIIWLLIGAATSYFAQKRGRDPFIWFMIGMFLGLLGLLLVFLLPSLEGVEEHETEEHGGPLIESPVPAALPYKTDQFSLKEWFYLDTSHQQHGPVGFNTLKSVWGEGSLSEKSYVWCEGMEQWKKIEELPELKEALA